MVSHHYTYEEAGPKLMLTGIKLSGCWVYGHSDRLQFVDCCSFFKVSFGIFGSAVAWQTSANHLLITNSIRRLSSSARSDLTQWKELLLGTALLTNVRLPFQLKWISTCVVGISLIVLQYYCFQHRMSGVWFPLHHPSPSFVSGRSLIFHM